MKITHGCVALLLAAATSTVLSAQDAAPARLSCALVGDNAIIPASAEPIPVSNLKRIELLVKLTGPVEELDDPEPASSGAVGAGTGKTLEIAVTRVTASNAREPVTAIISLHGAGAEPGEKSVNASLEIPLDAATRRRNIERLLTRIEEESVKAGRQAEFKALTANRELAIRTFEQNYMENAVGDFEVTCGYSSRRSNLQLNAPPLRLRVVFEGSFVDRLLR